MPKKLTTEEFIYRAEKVHNFKYNYSKVEYDKNNIKVIIICNEHGEFLQVPAVHLNGHGCIKCGFDSMVSNNPNNKPKTFLNKKGKESKICSTCNKEKEVSEFYSNKSQCKSCVCTRVKKYKQNNLDISRERNRDYERRNKSKAKKRSKKWYSNNKEKASNRAKIWRENNREKYRENARENFKKRKKECLKFLITTKMRDLLKRCRVNKTDRTHKMLGYTWKQLKQRLECQFTDGMSWNNYGEWHIDHKKPVSMFEVGAPAHTINALCNLQPLWATTREINGVVYEGNLNKQNKFK